jgi:hypothetical protein
VGDITFIGADAFRRFRRSRLSFRGGARMLIARLEFAFAQLAKVRYHDASTRRELEQMMDDFEET